MQEFQLEELLRADFSSFIGKSLETADPGATFLPNWHIDLLAEYLEAVRRGEITRLIINMPPRAMKSQAVSIAWPAWLLGQDPSARIMVASYSALLAVRHSLDCRAVVTAPWYRRVFPGTQLVRDQNEKHKFMTTARGFRFATSVGGTATGEGGNFLIVDDPLNPSQAANPKLREHVNRWYDHTFSTRLNDKKRGAIVLVMQRLHVEDLSGHLLERGGYTHLMLPACAPEAISVDFGRVRHHRAAGEALHPAREGHDQLARAKRELGAQAYHAQYQQQPLPQEGSLIQRAWLRYHEALPDRPLQWVQSWDTAIKSASHHDASVCLTFAEADGIAYLVEAEVMRLEYPDLKRRMQALARRIGRGVAGLPPWPA